MTASIDDLPTFKEVIDLEPTDDSASYPIVLAKRPGYVGRLLGFGPWVHVGAAGSFGRGLYADQRFEEGNVIGLYCGLVLGLAGTLEAEAARESSTSNKLLTLDFTHQQRSVKVYVDGGQPPQSNQEQIQLTSSSTEAGFVVFDQTDPRQSYPGAYCHLANDAYGVPGLSLNAKVQHNGIMVALRRIRIGSAILWNYGNNYWGLPEETEQ